MLLVIFLMLISSYCAAACSVSVTNVNFGNYSVFSTNPSDSTGTVTVNCSPKKTSYSISLNGGNSGSINQRTLKFNSQSITYNLYTNVARTIVWGDNTGGTMVTGSGQNPITVYGRIPAGQDVGSGTYTDSVLVTVQY